MKKFAKMTAFLLSAAMLLTGASIYANAQEKNENYVYLGGQPFGVRFYNDGVIIIELEEYYNGSHYVCPAKEGGLKVNDVIKKVNGTEIKTNEDLQSAAFNCGGKTVQMTVERDGKEINKSITPQKNTVGVYLLGAWVRDSCAGIGTVTYYDADNNYFAALGHGICDNDTGALLPLGSAEIVSASISSVTKSVSGKAGSLNGFFTDESLGNLTKNTPNGVFGTTIDNNYKKYKKLKIADFNEIRTGKAEIYTTVEDNNIYCCSAEIEKICNTSSKSNENFVIRITDDTLLEKCGGIVQGMSGSPIVQNGKLVGAVTHVFINTPDEGYGVAAQFMVSNSAE